MSTQVADQVRRETVAEAEARHHAILRELNEAVAQSSPGDQVTIRELQPQLLHLARQNQELQERLKAAGCSGSVRAPTAAGEGQGGSDKQSNAEIILICMLMNLFQTNQILLVHVSSINQVLAVLQEEVQKCSV